MEFINIYDKKRCKTNKIVDRYSYKKNSSEYDLSVQIWIMNDKKEIVLTKRSSKMSYPNLWECTEGLVDVNETSLEAAIREVKEELGINIYPHEIIKLKIDKRIEKPKYVDVYLCKKNILLSDIELQKEECIDAKLVNEDEYNLMCKRGEVIPYLNYFYEIYRKNEKYGIINYQNQVFIDKAKKYLKGNLHTHTIKSDGKYSVKEIIEIYKNKNYDFLGISDHDIYYDEKENSGVVLLSGIEKSCLYNGNDFTKGEYTHFNCFSSIHKDESINYYRNIQELQNIIDKISKNYSLIQFNHPLFSRLLDNEFLKLKGYHLIEIYNHKDFLEETGMQNAENLIRFLLNQKKKVLISAGDDFHGPYNNTTNDKCFGGWIMVDANKDEKSIINSIKEGKFYATIGPEIIDYRINGRCIEIKTSPVKNIIFYSNMRHCENLYDTNSREITEGKYILKGDEFYIWAKIIDKNGKIAWTQPIYIDASPYFNNCKE